MFFREANRRFGMKQCQVHSKKAIIRYQYILLLGYTFYGVEMIGGSVGFSNNRLVYQKAIKRSRIAWFYKQVKNDVALSDIFNLFRVAYVFNVVMAIYGTETTLS